MTPPPSELNARVESREDLHATLAILRVRPERGPVPEFEPGQFTNLGLLEERGADAPPELVRRAFSMASAPLERERMEFFVQRIDEGRFTSRLFELRSGDALWLDERVYGNFTLAGVPETADVVFVATGTGLGPFVSMLRHYRGRSRWRRCALVHSARREEDLGYRRELELAAASDPCFHYLPTLTRERPESGWKGLRGRVQALLEPAAFVELAGWPLDPASAHVFLCGNPAMIEETAEQLGALGFTPHRKRSPGQLHSERYW